MKKQAPAVTLLLIAACLVAAFAVQFRPDLFEQLAFRPDRPDFVRALASIFLHTSFVHLLGNMLFLAAVGPPLEFALKGWRLGLLFIVGGLVGNYVHLALQGQRASDMALVGASGAIAACVAVAAMRFLFVRVPLSPRFSVPVLSIILAWVILQVAGAIVKVSALPGGMSFWAHLGGFAAGLLLGFAFGAPKAASLQFGNDVLDRINHLGPVAAITAAKSHLAAHPDDMPTWRRLAEAQQDADEIPDAIQSLKHLIDAGKPADQDYAIKALGDLRSLSALDSRIRCQLADKLKGAFAESSRLLLESVAEGDTNDLQRPEALLALALADQVDAPQESRRWAHLLEAHYPLHPSTDIARQRGLLG